MVPNADVVRAAIHRVQDAKATLHSYLHVAWYTAFVVVYMAALYSQATGYQAGRVMAQLRAAVALGEAGGRLRFSGGRDVLAFLGNKVLAPTWADPTCGDGKCEAPWEYPAWGRFGCQPDCGHEKRVREVVVAVSADFTGHAILSAPVLMANTGWNLCFLDTGRSEQGEEDMCWFELDQAFTQPQETQIRRMSLLEGGWYVRIRGDYTGRVAGVVYDTTSSADNPHQLHTTPAWGPCGDDEFDDSANVTHELRKLMVAYVKYTKEPWQAGA